MIFTKILLFHCVDVCLCAVCGGVCYVECDIPESFPLDTYYERLSSSAIAPPLNQNILKFEWQKNQTKAQ